MTAQPVAVIPAAGDGTRLGLKGRSKELVPVGLRQRSVIELLVERLSLTGLSRAVVVTRSDKDDIEHVLGGAQSGVALEYLKVPRTPSSVHTVAAALARHSLDTPWVLGFPDIIFEPRDAFATVSHHFQRKRPDVALGLVTTDRPDKVDIVQSDDSGRVQGFRIKRPDIGLYDTWIVACWGSRFSQLLINHTKTERTAAGELFVGNVIGSAIELGMRVDAVKLEGGWALDVGTPRDLERAQLLDC